MNNLTNRLHSLLGTILCLVMLGVLSPAQGQDGPMKIYGGMNTNITEVPFQVALEINNGLICGGIIINEEWILTAAHCITMNENAEDIIVIAGAADRHNQSIGQRVGIDEIILHPQYDDNNILTEGNDIALLHLEQPLCFSDSVHAVAYATEITPVEVMSSGEPLNISGWGKGANGNYYSLQLQSAETVIISEEEAMPMLQECTGSGNIEFSENLLYAFNGTTSIGHGDSGGPAFVMYMGEPLLVGIASAVCDDAPIDYPSIYTNVKNYSDFITSNITEIVAFNFEDEYGAVKEEFCYGEDVYLDGTLSRHENQYYIDLWKRPIGDPGNFSYVESLGWTLNAEVGLVNLTQAFANLNYQLEPGYEYQVKLAIANLPCIPWTELTHTFTLTCCDPIVPGVGTCFNPYNNQVTVTIRGDSQSNWHLAQASDCTQDAGFASSFLTINWMNNYTSFRLPANSGCYWLFRIVDQGICGSSVIRILINTDNVDTVCGEFCDDWTIQTDYWPCELAIWQIPEANSFPDGTIITATLNNEPVNQVQMGEVNFDPSALDDPHGSTYARVCFTVQLPGCQPVTKCESINLGDCGLDGNPDGGRGLTHPDHTNNRTETTFSTNNPVNDVIRFSHPIEQGTAELYTMQGQRIKSFLLNGTSQLDVADLPAGTYLLSVAHSKGHETKLVVVTH